MSYMQTLEARLNTLFAGLPEEQAVTLIKEMKAIVLESYRNGQKAGAPKNPKRETRKSPAKPYPRS